MNHIQQLSVFQNLDTNTRRCELVRVLIGWKAADFAVVYRTLCVRDILKLYRCKHPLSCEGPSVEHTGAGHVCVHTHTYIYIYGSPPPQDLRLTCFSFMNASYAVFVTILYQPKTL